MDKNQATGLFLISALLLVYLFFFSPKKDDKKATGKTPPATTAAAPAAAPAAVPAIAPEAALDTTAGTAQDVTLTNANLTVTFSTRGGRVTAVRLNKYKTFFGQPLDLFDAKSARMDTRFRTVDGKTVKFSDLVFQSVPSQAAGASVLTFTAPVAGGSIVQTYTLPANSFELAYNLRLNGLEQAVAQEPLTFTFVDQVRQTEQDLKQNRNHTTINHYLAAGDQGALAEASEKPEEIKAAGPVKWAAHKHDFFVAGLIADQQPFTGGAFNSDVNLADSTSIKTLSTTLTIPVAEVEQGRGQYRFFFGPNSFNLLKQVAPEFDRNVYLGWGLFRWVNRFVVLPVFHFLEQFIGSYGLIIALLVLLIKLVTWPLTYKTYESQARMKVLKPEIDELKAKYGDDQTKVQQETMKLYQTFGVSPLSGCVPTLLTLPILFAMFQFFPNAIELRQQSFLWAKDLSSYDVFIKLPFYVKWYGDHVSMFTLLMTASTLLMTWQSNQTNTAMQGPMKTYSYLMPIIFLFVLNSFAAGLTWYYFVSNVITFGQQALTKAFVDDTKIRAQLDANKIKNKDKKPGGIQGRIAEAMKAAQEREAQAKKKS
ncbi:membrane protein insertase YidC [Hymenobacter sp. BT770]|uniref:membrane protein insertase YidC n=1 Tax=Hymenobacter sp. BT770 TaxID=2886942 RepID=UPI001D104C28|nr:membrane protein insertase YidC [Hymenobacter sp. BT770]MCC3152732.1 membrane protein insertase YidC [Hymenobacter sp. BT770]MDO3414805.1 membrane protein insertase YidC [Hymenobacter sp. BT770]